MAGKKRSATQGVASSGQNPPPAVTTQREKAWLGTGQVVSAFCPVCAKAVHPVRASKGQEYFSSIPWRDDQPFGMTRLASGRGSFKEWKYINPDDAPELFAAMRARFVDAVKLWVKRGWIKAEDLE